MCQDTKELRQWVIDYKTGNNLSYKMLSDDIGIGKTTLVNFCDGQCPSKSTYTKINIFMEDNREYLDHIKSQARLMRNTMDECNEKLEEVARLRDEVDYLETEVRTCQSTLHYYWVKVMIFAWVILPVIGLGFFWVA